MRDGFNVRRNSFQETLLGLEYLPSADYPADIFSRACVEAFAETDYTQFGYSFTQIFEPDVLYEVALLEGVPYDALTSLRHRPSASAARLADLVDGAPGLSLVELLNVASALISISRFEIAARLVDDAAARAASPRERFEVGWLEFLISNRRDDGASSPRAFARMREAIDAGDVPRGRVLDACTQGVVWYVKRREIPEDVFTWCMRVGGALAGSSDVPDSGTVSSWYRGLAMVPAAKGDARETREYMRRAHEAAEATVSKRPRAYEMNTLKTYYESALKEHVYVTRDLEAAEEAGRALIVLDPAWAPSYGELAEAYQKFGKLDRAAALYEKAVAAGPPYVGHHLLHAARCRARLEDDAAALAHYSTLVELAPNSEQIRNEGLEVARRISAASHAEFENGARAASEAWAPS